MKLVNAGANALRPRCSLRPPFALIAWGLFTPLSTALAHGPGQQVTSEVSWMLMLSPHGAVLLACGVVATILALHFRRFIWARTALAAIAVALPLTSFTQIAVIPVPNVFADGEPANAADVNENFAAVVQQIADHANNAVLHGSPQGISSVDGLSGGTINGDVTIDGGRLIVDEVVLRNDANELVLFLGVSDEDDGFLAYFDQGALILTPDGDLSLIGPGDVELQSLENSVNAIGGDNGSINLSSQNSTTITSGGAAIIDATRIDLNAP